MRFIMPNLSDYIGRVTYHERYRVPAWWWLIAALLVVTIAVAVLAYVPPWPGWIVVGLIGISVAGVLFSYGNTEVTVADGVLRVGHNSIEGRWIGMVEALDREASQHALTTGADTTELLVTRPYIPELVRVAIADDADPHSHWLVSSRRSKELAGAIAVLLEKPR